MKNKITETKKILNDFAAFIGYNIDFEIGYEKEMSSFLNTETITVDPAFYETAYEAEFKNNLSKWYKNNGFDFGDLHIATVALLHEIGHLIAYEHYSPFKKMSALKPVTKNYTLSAYKKLFVERDADFRALELYQNFPKEIKRTDKKLRKLWEK